MRSAILSTLLFLSGMAVISLAEEFNNVQYLCADWGPAIKIPTKVGDKPQFSDTEEVYFLKQVGRFTRKKRVVPDLLSGSKTEDVGRSISIYLCKMKPDGTEKTEIKELWKNPNFPIDTQGQSTWMDVNEKTRKIALAIAYAGNEITGLWTMNLDGSDLKRIITPAVVTDQYLQAINHPSWTPDGQWIVLEEELRGMNPNRYNIARCDDKGGNFKRLLEASTKEQYIQPSVSPDGKLIAFTKISDGYQRWIWLMNFDGSDAHPLGGKQSLSTWGDWPAWSLDGKRIYALSAGIIDATSGQVVNDRRPLLNGESWAAECAHWGRLGLLGSATGFRITLTDSEMQTVKLLAASILEEVGAAPPKSPGGAR